MICENCGAKIGKGESYCPKCGMELFNPEYKPLKKKYLRGEYREEAKVSTQPYDLEAENLSEVTYQQDTHQNQNYNQDKNYNQHNHDEDYQYNQGSDRKQYNWNKDYNQKYNRNKNYEKNYNQEGYHQKKKYKRGYDLDEYYESEKKGSSIWKIVFLFLIVALLFGFVMGFMFFSTKI
jgi:hypothetical protein